MQPLKVHLGTRKGVIGALSLRLSQGESGQSMVESALSLLIALMLMFITFEVSMLAYTYSVLNDAVREGVRYAVVHGVDSASCSGPSPGCSDASGANVKAVVTSYAKYTFHDVSAMTVTVNYPDATQSQPMSLVTVSVDYTYIPYISLPGNLASVHLQSEGRIVW